jgi:F-type H+-transporting ATPase subunit b
MCSINGRKRSRKASKLPNAFQGDAYLKKAQETLRQETEQARQLLRQEVADISVMAASRILRKELDAKAQAQLIEDTLTDAAREHVAQN